MSQIELSIIILNYKSAQLTKQAVRGVLQFPPKVSYEIIVMDNSSDDNCLKRLQEEILNTRTDLPSIHLVQNQSNIGYARANNKGIQKSQGKYILILNPDTVIFEHTIHELYDYITKHPDVGMVGPEVLNPDKTHQASCFRFPTFMYPLYRRTILAKTKRGAEWLKWFLMENHKPDWNKIQEVDWLLGACILLSKKAIDQVGLLDERFFLFLEDTDWAYRMWSGGWKIVYVPTSKLVHFPHRASMETGIMKHIIKKTAWIHLFSWVKFYTKNIMGNRNYPPAKSPSGRIDKQAGER